MNRAGLPVRVRGFTFVEIMAAMFFLAIALPVITAAFSLSSRAGEAAERTSLAGQLAENQLNEIVIDQTGSSGSAGRGDFGADYPGFRWESRQEAWTVDGNLTQLTVEVFFPVQGRERSVTLTTLLSNSASTGTPST